MSKATATPDKVKRQREAAEAMKHGPDVTDLLKKIEEEEADAYREFEAAQKAKREKALTAVLEPLNTRRSELSQTINEAHIEIADIDKQIAKLTGKAAPAAASGTRKPRGKNKSKADKLQIATVVYGSLKDTGKKHSAGDLKTMLDGVSMKEAMNVWHEAHPDKKIQVEGSTVDRRYFVGK